jgi:hypothetical protein
VTISLATLKMLSLETVGTVPKSNRRKQRQKFNLILLKKIKQNRSSPI